MGRVSMTDCTHLPTYLRHHLDLLLLLSSHFVLCLGFCTSFPTVSFWVRVA